MNKPALETSENPMDAGITWSQISTMVKMSCVARNAVSAPTYLMFEVGRRTARKITKLAITLDASDTYTVERIEIDRKAYDSKIIQSVPGVHAENLSRVVLDLGDR